MQPLKVDHEILNHLGIYPGCNLEQTSKALRRDFSGAWIKDRIHTLISRGLIRAEVGTNGRYRLYLSDEHKPMEA